MILIPEALPVLSANSINSSTMNFKMSCNKLFSALEILVKFTYSKFNKNWKAIENFCSLKNVFQTR